MKATKASVKRLLNKWRPRLGLDDRWNIEYKIYNDESWPDNHKGASAFIRPSPGYFYASMHINADACGRDKDSLEHIILHELIHIPTWTMAAIVRDALGEAQEEHWRELMEQLVETFTRALLK